MSRGSLLTTLLLPLALTACDSAVPGPDGEFAEGCEASEAVPVRTTGTYLRTDDVDDADDPTVVRLRDVGLEAGDTVLFERLGEYQFGNSDPTRVREEMAAVFSRTDNLLDRDERDRVPGAIDAGEDYETRRTFVDDLATDIAEDFFIDEETTVTVPQGAEYLFVAPPDDRFDDNLDDDGDYRLCITELS